MWEKKGELTRGQKVVSALIRGVCFECGEKTREVTKDESDYLGENHVRCPKCGWQAMTEQSPCGSAHWIKEGVFQDC